jgi:hypothetical protein
LTSDNHINGAATPRQCVFGRPARCQLPIIWRPRRQRGGLGDLCELTHLIESSVIDVTSIIDPQIIRSSIHLPFAFAATRRCS